MLSLSTKIQQIHAEWKEIIATAVSVGDRVLIVGLLLPLRDIGIAVVQTSTSVILSEDQPHDEPAAERSKESGISVSRTVPASYSAKLRSFWMHPARVYRFARVIRRDTLIPLSITLRLSSTIWAMQYPSSVPIIQ